MAIKKQHLVAARDAEAYKILGNQQLIYDSIRSSLVAGATNQDLLTIYKAAGNPRIVVTGLTQRSRMIELGLVHASVVSAHEEHTYLTDKGVQVYKRLAHAFRGKTYDPLWIMKRKTKEEYSLQSFVKELRTAWSQRPRITRFTLRAWVYQWNIWLERTAPETPMIDWSAFNLPEWSDEDRKTQRQVWHDSDLLAFWLCPDGIDAGIEAHDEFLRICEKRGIKSVEKQKEVISEITGIAQPKPKKAPEKASKVIDEILFELEAIDLGLNETTKKKSNFAVSDGYDTKCFNSKIEADEYAKMVTRLQAHRRKEYGSYLLKNQW